MQKEYALYKGDECLCIGTIKEIAKHQNVKEETVRFYGYPVHMKRIKENAKVLIEIDGPENKIQELLIKAGIPIYFESVMKKILENLSERMEQ